MPGFGVIEFSLYSLQLETASLDVPSLCAPLPLPLPSGSTELIYQCQKLE